MNLSGMMFSSARFLRCLSIAALGFASAISAWGQSPLSQNSGINASDTYVVFDVSLQSQSTASLPQAMYDASTRTTSAAINLNPSPRRFHVEAGFDANDGLVVNMFSSDPTVDVTTTNRDLVGQIRLADGKFIIYDQSGNPLPLVLPNNMPLPNPLAWLGLTPGPSVVSNLVVSSPKTLATQIGATITAQSATSQELTKSGTTQTASTRVMNYQSAGSMWTLNQVQVTPAAVSGIQSTHTFQFSNVVWNTNSAGDSRRSARGTTIATTPAASGVTFTSPPAPVPSSVTPQFQVTNSGLGRNVVFQHGIFSDASTWNKMTTWLNSDFQFNTELVPTLTSTNFLAAQASDLVGQMSSTGKNNFLIIGHSQGGLIARNVAQLRPDLASGVITVDTPHLGALLDLNGQQAIADGITFLAQKLADRIGCFSAGDNIWCALAFFVGNNSFPIVDFGFTAGIPATHDLLPIAVGPYANVNPPANPYLSALNAAPEFFPRVGINTATIRRWNVFRLIGDHFCDPWSICGGNAVFLYTEIAYDILYVIEAIAIFYWDFDLLDLALDIQNIMNHIDGFWNGLVALPGETSDGIVGGFSQAYSGAVNYPIFFGDSHLGSTRSPFVRAAITLSLDAQFFVPRAGCTYTVSGNTTSFPATGGATNLNITTGSLCSWSAVSNVPWISIIGADTGKGSSVVSYAVDANLTTAPRTGTLTVAGSTLTITQQGLPAGVSIGTVALSGRAAPFPIYAPPCSGRTKSSCTQYFDTGTISITVNGHVDEIGYGPSLTAQSAALSMAASINRDSVAPVNAGVIGSTVILISKALGDPAYAYSASVVPGDPAYFPRAAFQTVDGGPTFTGTN